MDFDLVRIECDISAEFCSHVIPGLYVALRNFEREFKSVCCQSDQLPCTSCSLYSDCPYLKVFGQQLSPDPEIVRLHQKPALPFSLYINEMTGNASTCTAGIAVIGDAVQHSDIFHTTLLGIAETAVSNVLPPTAYSFSSYTIDYLGERHCLGHSALMHENVIVLSGRQILENCINADSVRLTLKSPLRLMSNGSIARRFDFAAFFRSQLRRCSSLCAYYGTGKPVLDFSFLSAASLNVAVLEDGIRYSQPSWSNRLNRAGLTGTAECSGLTGQMFPLLLLGSYVNAGKGASYGSGVYQIEGM